MVTTNGQCMPWYIFQGLLDSFNTSMIIHGYSNRQYTLKTNTTDWRLLPFGLILTHVKILVSARSNGLLSLWCLESLE